MDRNQKEQIVKKLASRLSEAQAVILTDFKGLNVAEISDLRRRVGESGGEYHVVKNTLLRLAANGTDTDLLHDFFVGNNALGMTTADPVPLAKALVNFAKENEKLVIKGGILSGKILNLEQIKVMGNLPSREILLGKMLGTMNAVPAGLVRVLSAVISNFVYALAAIRDQKEQA